MSRNVTFVFRTSTNFSPIGAVNAFSALGLFRVTMATAPLRSTVTNSSVFRVAAVIERKQELLQENYTYKMFC